MLQGKKEEQDNTYSIYIDIEDSNISIEKSLLEYSKLLKHCAKYMKTENNTINLLPFALPFSKVNLERIFNYVSKYKSYDGEEEKKEEFCVSIIESDEYFLQNFGDILQISQFLQVDCLTDVMERYITKIINDAAKPDDLCLTFGWEKTKIPTDLEWTMHSNDW